MIIHSFIIPTYIYTLNTQPTNIIQHNLTTLSTIIVVWIHRIYVTTHIHRVVKYILHNITDRLSNTYYNIEHSDCQTYITIHKCMIVKDIYYDIYWHSCQSMLCYNRLIESDIELTSERKDCVIYLLLFDSALRLTIH